MLGHHLSVEIRQGVVHGAQGDEIIRKVYFNTGKPRALVEPFRRTDKRNVGERRASPNLRVDDEMLEHVGKRRGRDDAAEGRADVVDAGMAGEGRNGGEQTSRQGVVGYPRARGGKTHEQRHAIFFHRDALDGDESG